jgi:hypothetical protein
MKGFAEARIQAKKLDFASFLNEIHKWRLPL